MKESEHEAAVDFYSFIIIILFLIFFSSTCTDCDGLHELVPPGVSPHHQRQVGLLDQLVHGALSVKSRNSVGAACVHSETPRGEIIHALHHMMAVATRSRMRTPPHQMHDKTTQARNKHGGSIFFFFFEQVRRCI